MEDKIDVAISSENDVTVVSFNAASISNVESITSAAVQIKEFTENHRLSALVFDFSGVRFFCSQVLGLLLDVRANLKAHEAEVVISAINPQLYRVFKITNLDKVFRFFPDKKAAVKAVKAG